MKRVKKFKASSSSLFVILLAIGFAAGYTTKEMTFSPTQNIEAPAQRTTALSKESVAVCFTPSKKCQSTILAEIGAAKKSIFVQAYSFTDKEIATALGDAALRGVDVRVLLDKSNRGDDRSAKSILLHQNIPLRFDAPNGIAHNKIMIIDESKVISGSYNFSVAAYKRNTENLLVISNPSLAQSYLQNWQARWQLSKKN
jgi:phosphatidylserine/phosphatidylglycerophosphate/cardiolipin synthase-like enzyme